MGILLDSPWGISLLGGTLPAVTGGVILAALSGLQRDGGGPSIRWGWGQVLVRLAVYGAVMVGVSYGVLVLFYVTASLLSPVPGLVVSVLAGLAILLWLGLASLLFWLIALRPRQTRPA
jgi:hypothetical protein